MSCPVDRDSELAKRRTDEPVRELPAEDDPTWLVSGYADVRAVLDDPTFASGDAPTARPDPGALAHLDPPAHTRARKVLARQFTVRWVNALRPRVERAVTARLDAMATNGPPCDLVTSYARPVTGLVLGDLLGVPETDRDRFASRIGTGEQDAYLADLVAARRAEPGDDLLSRLTPELEDEQLRGTAAMLLSQAFEPTSAMLNLGTVLLLRHPEQLAAVRDDPRAAGPAVEEMLRYASVVHSTPPRRATKDVRLHDQVIGVGDRVRCALATANRDPDAVQDEPERFDITRRPAPHVAFGHGPHQCLGQQLARLVLRVAQPALFQRFPDLRCHVPLDRLRFRASATVVDVAELPVTW